jgi:SAM-dependent methyltransferase
LSGWLKKNYGKKSEHFQRVVTCLEDAQKHAPTSAQDHFDIWQQDGMLHQTSNSLLQQDSHLHKRVYCTQTYYVMVVQMLVACALARSHDDIKHCVDMPATDFLSQLQGDFFEALGYKDGLQVVGYGWYLQAMTDDLADALHILKQSFMTMPDTIRTPIRETDALKRFYQDIFSKQWRHALGEHFTPDWLAMHTLERLQVTGEETVFDPACGTGTFLINAFLQARAEMPLQDALTRIAGMDVQPLAVFSARANFMLHIGIPETALHLPVQHGDSICEPPAHQYDIVVGNPPWLNWEYLDDAYRQKTRHLWQAYGLFPHHGLDAILGKSKKDLSLLMLLVSADKTLRTGGRVGMIMPHIALKSSGASAGLRRWQIGETPLKLYHIDDMSAMRPFQGVAARVVVLYLEKEAQTVYPVTCDYWQQKTTIKTGSTLDKARQSTERLPYHASPIQKDDITSPVCVGRKASLSAMRKLIGENAYRAHTGVYTGGANGVYWMQQIDEDGERVLVENLPHRGKRVVPQKRIWLERDLLYPILHGNGLEKWRGTPHEFILMVQDVHRRQGYAPDFLQDHYPLAWAYLHEFESTLRQRAAFKRYFSQRNPFYSMFDVGAYSFAPYKVVWHGIGVRRMVAAVVSQQAGKAIMSNQATMPFIAIDNEDEAHYLAGCLNSAPFGYAIVARTQLGGKSFAPPGIVKHLAIDAYDSQVAHHRRISELARQAAQSTAQEQIHIEQKLAEVVAEAWGISPQQLDAIQQNLQELC